LLQSGGICSDIEGVGRKVISTTVAPTAPAKCSRKFIAVHPVSANSGPELLSLFIHSRFSRLRPTCASVGE
jgi:hypothetical protein